MHPSLARYVVYPLLQWKDGARAHYLAARGGLSTSSLKAVVTTAEMLYPDQRALLERTFVCPVINEYGSSECGHMAGECPAGSLHVAAENLLIEFASGSGPGSDSELIVTDLNNMAMPLLRYQIGDVGAPGGTCPCGRTLPVLHLAVGRTEDLVMLPDGRRVDGAVFSAAVDALMEQGVTVRQFRAIQHAPEVLEVLIATDALPETVSSLSEMLQMLLGARLTVMIRIVDRIPLEGTGKLRRFVSRLPASADSPIGRRGPVRVGVAGEARRR
jgi:phenylacetate-CoA ligase